MRRRVKTVRFINAIEVFSKPIKLWMAPLNGVGHGSIPHTSVEFDTETRDLRVNCKGTSRDTAETTWRTLIIPWHVVESMELETDEPPKGKSGK